MNDKPDRNTPGKRWYIVGLLSLLYALSVVDRFVLALLAGPVIEEFELTASQMGLLLGAGFAILYSIMGLPLAHLLDRHKRKYILIGGVALWSLSTMLSAFAQDFLSLLFYRSGVAIGEAVLTPAAISLIADLFERDKRRLPISVYTSISSVMVTGSFVVNAAVLQLASSWSSTLGMEPWRITFLLVGAPGILLAAIFALTVREPSRRGEQEAAPPEHSSRMSDVRAYYVANWRFYLPFYVALGSMSALVLAIISWTPTMLTRERGMSTADAGYIFGLMGIATGFVGTFLWPAIGARIDRDGHGGGFLRIILVCLLIGSVGAFSAMLTGSTVILFIGLALAMFTFPQTNTTLSYMLIQGYGPAPMRARLIALHILVVNLFGFVVGPQFIGAYVDAAPTNSISSGIAWLAAAAGPLSVICMIMALRAFARETQASRG